ncbi:MAG: O-antigen ligase family protein [Myxococcales bacterium]
MSAVYRIPGDAKGALVGALVLAILSSVINDPLATVGLMTIAVPIIMYAMTRIPLRHSMLGLMFFALTLPNPNEGFVWKVDPDASAPFELVGWLYTAHWNTIARDAAWLKPAIFSGLDLFFLMGGYIVYTRRKSRSKLDYAGAVRTPEPMRKLARISLMVTGLIWLIGLVTGGNFGMSLWQVNSVMYLPVIFLLFSEAIRGPQDFPAVLRVLCFAVIYRALFATYVIHAFPQAPDPETGSTKLPYATSHADSMLFADAFAAVVCVFLERLARFRSRLILVLPIAMLGMMSNNRRLVWVHVAFAMLTLYFITEDNPVKRRIRRVVYASIPVVLGYIAAGWNSEFGTVFKPVRMLRSVVDTKSDRSGSSFWRELENLNLVTTFKHNPIFGTGYGHGFEEVVQLPEVAYELERYCPHNSILGLWAFGGFVGFAGTTMLWAAGMYYAMYAYRRSRDQSLRAGALASIACILIYIMHCWGDLGLGTWTGVFTAACSIAVAGKAAASVPQTAVVGSKAQAQAATASARA